jgi:hypothetical protein
VSHVEGERFEVVVVERARLMPASSAGSSTETRTSI